MQWSVLTYSLFDCIVELCDDAAGVNSLAKCLNIDLDIRLGWTVAEATAALIRECRTLARLPELVGAIHDPQTRSQPNVDLGKALMRISNTSASSVLLTVDPRLRTHDLTRLADSKNWQLTHELLSRSRGDYSRLHRECEKAFAHIIVCGDPLEQLDLTWLAEAYGCFASPPVIVAVPRGSGDSSLERLGLPLLQSRPDVVVREYDPRGATLELALAVPQWLDDLYKPFANLTRPRRLWALHVSDLHFGGKDPPDSVLLQLEADLLDTLRIKTLDYVIVTGDVANGAEVKEYGHATEWILQLLKRFHVPRERAILVPGNHDVSYAASKRAYRRGRSWFRHAFGFGKNSKPHEEEYKNRFRNYIDGFFQKVHEGRLPANCANEGMTLVDRENHIAFVAVNSSWRLDHLHPQRKGIHPGAYRRLSDELRLLEDGERWLRIFVSHHPFSSDADPDSEFIQLLAVGNFDLMLHGHIHESRGNVYAYDRTRKLHILGAGTMNAVAKDQVPGIAHQYHLLSLDPLLGTIRVVSRKREKREGAWRGDARWGSADDPRTMATFWPARWHTSD